MAKPSFKITEENKTVIYEYLERLIGRGDLDVSKGPLRQIRTPEKLQEWCQRNMTPKQWETLKSTTRQMMKRRRDFKARKPKKKTVQLEQSAWALLDSVAKEEECTLSKAIEIMEATYWSSKGQI